MLAHKDGWQSRWVKSDWKSNEGKAGSFKHTAGKWSGDPDDKGIIMFVLFVEIEMVMDPRNPMTLMQRTFVSQLVLS